MDILDLLRQTDFDSAPDTQVIEYSPGQYAMVKKLTVFDPRVISFLHKNRHPNIPPVYAYVVRNGVMLLAEEYIKGRTLDVFVRETDPGADVRISIIISICDALEFLHNANPPIIHRDIKPENILIGDNGNVYLIDYDAAKFHNQYAKRDTVLLGTAGVAAPEQYGFSQSDPRTDIFAMGKLMEYLFPDIIRPAWMRPIIIKATSINKDDRFANIRMLKRSLTDHRVSDSFWPPPGYRSNNPGIWALASVGYVLLIALMAGVITATIKTYAQNVLLGILVTVIMAVLSVTLFEFGTDWIGFFRIIPHIGKNRLGRAVIAGLCFFLLAINSSVFGLPLFGVCGVLDLVTFVMNITKKT